MYKFCIIDGEVVTDVILADSQELAEQLTGKPCVHSLDAGIGWAYDAETGEFTEPEPVELVAEVINELIAIEEAPTEG